MKVSLVVASGAHQGKVIPITGPQFLIGRDAGCHLRPASQAVSKQHCAVIIRDGQIIVKDFGSTNGTLVNDELLRGAELVMVNGASLKLGPLDFIVSIEVSAPQPDGTPLPSDTPESAAALAAVKAATGAAAGQRAPVRDATPNPAIRKAPNPAGSKEIRPKEGSKEAPALSGSKEAAALKSTAAKPAASKPAAEPTAPTRTSLSGEESHEEDMAAMLLNMEDEGVPDGSTVVELPAVDAQGNPIKPEPKPEEKKKTVQTREEMTSAASDLLRKMMRRPK
jgi:predicted component of type VI protein secretion system